MASQSIYATHPTEIRARGLEQVSAFIAKASPFPASPVAQMANVVAYIEQHNNQVAAMEADFNRNCYAFHEQFNRMAADGNRIMRRAAQHRNQVAAMEADFDRTMADIHEQFNRMAAEHERAMHRAAW